jgi:dihydrofolate synthase / folylpolyglutamate synthase
VNALEYLFSLEHFGIKFGLANIEAIVDRLGHPERSFRSIHVAGTNGKGSVTAMVDAGLRAAGYRTARYTSPHLVSLNERFVVDGRPVDEDAMTTAIDDVRAAIESLRSDGTLDVHPTFFEVTTAVAFELFRRAKVSWAVVEVGLGGRLDATNVLLPEVTAITSIALDHQLYLGSTLDAIAAEKAGIIKPGVPLVVGELDPSAAAVIEQIAHQRGAPIVRTSAADLRGRQIALRGSHQRANAAIALAILETVAARGTQISAEAKEAAVTRVEWPGRLDLRRLPDGRELLMDAAHNAAGAQALADYLQSEQRVRVPLVFAAMRDKDAEGMFRALLPSVGSLIVTRAENPRSADPADLAAAARRISPSLTVATESSLPRALEAAWRQSPTRRITVAGSIFLLGDVMKRLGLH